MFIFFHSSGSWKCNTLVTSCEELTHLKRPWCWERLKAGWERDDRWWDGWMALASQWTWVWVNSGSWWWTGRPGLLRSMGSQRVGHDWATELNWTELKVNMGELDTHLGYRSENLRLPAIVVGLTPVGSFIWWPPCNQSFHFLLIVNIQQEQLLKPLDIFIIFQVCLHHRLYFPLPSS